MVALGVLAVRAEMPVTPMDTTQTLIGFPLGGPEDGRFGFSIGDTALRESIWNILMTRPGERLMRPEFGAGLGQFVHQPNSQTTRALMVDTIRTAITRWEPRIVLLGITADADTRDLTLVRLTIDYRAVANSRADRLDLTVSLGGAL